MEITISIGGLTIKPKQYILKPVLFLALTITVVILTLPSMIIVLFSSERAPIEEPKQVNQLENEPTVMVNVERASTQTIESVPLEDYVASVVASEMPAEFEPEALKAQALAARTYIIQYMLATGTLDTEPTITDTVQHQVYKNQEELKDQWGTDYSWKMEKITDAVAQTTNQILTYDDEPITPAFFSTSNGKTENAEDYWENALPYLVSVDSPWDLDSPKFLDQKSIPIAEVEERLGLTISGPLTDPAMTYTDSGRVETIELFGKNFSGREIREKLDLRSTDFAIDYSDGYLVFTTKGYGHGVGMSQYGANGMAEDGMSYQEIISHYYPGVEITDLAESDHAQFVFGHQSSETTETN